MVVESSYVSCSSQPVSQDSGYTPPRQAVEREARALWMNSSSTQVIANFLKRVPWHEFDRDNQSRGFVRELPHNSTLRPAYVVFGSFMHGGIVGVTKVTRDFPYLARLVINHMRSQRPEFQGTSVCVSCNVQSSPHRDSYNLESTENTVIPLVLPETGGEVWMQCEDDAQVDDQQMQVMQCGHTTVQGHLKAIQKGVVLCPQRWHATAPWTGDRVVMIGYSIGGLRKLDERT